MSKFSIIGLVINAATTVGIAAPLGIKINKEKISGQWGTSYVESAEDGNKRGTGIITKKEHIATQELYDWICREDIYKVNINIRKFCLATHDLPPTKIN